MSGQVGRPPPSLRLALRPAGPNTSATTLAQSGTAPTSRSFCGSPGLSCRKRALRASAQPHHHQADAPARTICHATRPRSGSPWEARAPPVNRPESGGGGGGGRRRRRTQMGHKEAINYRALCAPARRRAIRLGSLARFAPLRAGSGANGEIRAHLSAQVASEVGCIRDTSAAKNNAAGRP